MNSPRRNRQRRNGRFAKPVFVPVPRPFDFGFTARRPLVPMPAVAMFLDKTPKEVIALIESGRLRWAFDIRTTKSARRELRILRQSLFEFTGLYAPTEIIPGAESTEFEYIMNFVLPEGTVLTAAGLNSHRPTCAPLNSGRVSDKIASLGLAALPREPVLGGTEIARCFSCNNQHVLNLIHENSLHAITLNRGPKASPLVTRPSIMEFLKKRRMS